MASALDSNAVWFVTGCSTGIGKCFANHIYNAGHNIVATARNIDSLSYLPDGPKVLKLALDVCSEASIDAAFEAIVKRFNRLDIIINNAGFGSTGEAEGFPEEEARLQMETNFWGAVRITQKGIQTFREVNAPGQGGVVVQISSIAGYATFPGHSFYHATKFALEGFSKSVNKELNPKWNIKVMIVAPGGVNTEFHDNLMFPARNPVYANDPDTPLNRLLKFMSNFDLKANGALPERIAAVVFDTVMGQNERPLPTRLSLGTETLKFVGDEIEAVSKELNDWKDVTITVSPSSSKVDFEVKF
ncbi:putative oxidoreductase [Hyphodiscus hymeniophilus]|uniref:Oxidoreductase n=1 Tax=Hyphodiscus hymeniophilus TaxID=353542 RepID=A0A9P6VPW2_9HELO|nr:putative oxidoreductase [Hyphodiscus hymeniophilus]